MQNSISAKDYIWNPAICSCENGEYLGSIINDSVITCDEIINAADSVSANVPANDTSTVSTNVISTATLNFHNKKVGYKMECYILHTVLLKLILLFIIAIIGYRCAKHKSKQKKCWPINNIKMENNELKNVSIKNYT